VPSNYLTISVSMSNTEFSNSCAGRVLRFSRLRAEHNRMLQRVVRYQHDQLTLKWDSGNAIWSYTPGTRPSTAELACRSMTARLIGTQHV